MGDEIKDIAPAPANPIVSWFDGIEVKLREVDTNLAKMSEVLNSNNNDIRTSIGRIGRAVDSKFNDVFIEEEKNINKIISLIESKTFTFTHEIKSDPAINSMLNKILLIAYEIKKQLMQTHNWVHILERDERGLITKIISNPVNT